VFGLKGVSPPVIQITERIDEGKSLTKTTVQQKHRYLVELISNRLSEMSKSGQMHTHGFPFSPFQFFITVDLDTYRYLHTVKMSHKYEPQI